MIFNYTDRNHFKFGYGSRLEMQCRQSPAETFSFRYGAIESSALDWRQANREAARKIRQNFSGELWVLLSGGTDSEVCARAFLEEGIPIQLATLRYARGANAHDLEYVERFSAESGLPVKYFDLDVERFWNSEDLHRYVVPIQCVSPILACHLWLADQVKGVPIIAQGEPHLKKRIPADYVPGESPYLPSDWYLVESERLCSLFRHFIHSGRPAVPGFFQYTPEQIYAFCFNNPIMADLVNDRVVGKLGTRTSKNAMIWQFYPEIERRPKYTGFETLDELHQVHRLKLAQRFPYSDAVSKLSYSDLLSMLRGMESMGSATSGSEAPEWHV